MPARSQQYKWAASLVFWTCAVLSATTALGQRYPFFNIGIEQGLVQSQVFSLTQDSAGHLWAGTLGGLSCYDGHAFHTYTMREGLPSNTITNVCCDKQGRICIGTARGLSIYDGFRFRNYNFSSPDNPKGNAVMQLSHGAGGILWCVAGDKLYMLRNGKITPVETPIAAGRITALRTIGPDVLVGIAAQRSVYRYRLGRWDSLALPEEKPHYVFKIYEDAAKRLILLAGDGVYRYAESSWSRLLERRSNKEPMYYSFAEGLNGGYWISTSSGVIRLTDSSAPQYFNRKTGLTDLLVYDLMRDHEGNLWMATNGEGLYRFSGAAFTAVDERMGLDGPQVSSIVQAGSGVVYLGTYDGGLYRYDGATAKRVAIPGGPARSAVSCLELRGQTLWIGTQGMGLWRYNIERGAMSRYEDERIGPTVLSMIQNDDGIWLGNGKGILLVANDSLHLLPLKQPAEAFTFIGKDSILLGTMDGLMCYSHDTLTRFYTHSGADNGQVVCITALGSRIWIGTSDNGLFGYDMRTGRNVHITRKEGLRSDFIYNVYAAPDGTVWVGTGFGICRINPSGMRPTVTFYGRNAGITGMESNRNAVRPLEDGSIWFGTTGGALLYHPQNAVAVTRPVSLQLQHVALFGEAVKDTDWYKGISPIYGVPQSLRLPWRQNNLSFSFNAVSLSGDESIAYRYRLDGLPAPWSEWSPTNTVTFSALPPGHYELQVQCSIDGTHPQPKVLRYPFEIITPFHKTTLFYILIIVGCIVLGVGLQYLAARGKRRRLAQLAAVRREEQARVRQRTAEDFHDEVGNKLTRINVLTNVLRSKIGAVPEATRLIDQIQDNAAQLYGGTRDILWALQPSNDNLYQVMHRIRDFGRDLFGDTDTGFEMEEVPAQWKDYRLPMDASRNLIMIFKEALNNVLKYAGATRVVIASLMQDGELLIFMRDNGEGFECAGIKRGQGLTNMETRARRLGGSLEIESGKGRGTNITLKLKIPSSKGVFINDKPPFLTR